MAFAQYDYAQVVSNHTGPKPQVIATVNNSVEVLEHAKLTIQVAEARIIGNFSTPEDETAFLKLIRANTIIGFIDDEPGFVRYWQQNKQNILKTPQMAGTKPLNWQMFLAQTYTGYKLVQTNAEQDPRGFLKWLKEVGENPIVDWATVATTVAVIGAFNFVTGMLKGALIAGPAAGAVNSVINPIMSPIYQRLTIFGNKHLGPVQMIINQWLFETKAPKETASMTAEQLAEHEKQTRAAKDAVAGLRTMLEGRSYQISADNWARSMKALNKTWNKTNFLHGLMPDVYRGGRDRVAFLVVQQSSDFANKALTAASSAEVYKQGAEGILNRMMTMATHDPSLERSEISQRLKQIEYTGQALSEAVAEQIKIDREAPERSAEIQLEVEKGKAELMQLGADAKQAERFVENHRLSQISERQVATALASQVLHDAMYSDTIKGAETMYAELYKNNSLGYLHAQMKMQVIEILDRIEFKLEVSIAETKSQLKLVTEKGHEKSPEKPKVNALELMLKKTSSSDGIQALGERGSIVKEEARTSGERIKEAAGRAAGRK